MTPTREQPQTSGSGKAQTHVDAESLERFSEFSLGHRMLRALWNTTWLLLFRTSPVPIRSWRRFLLRLFGAKVGKGVVVYPSTRVWAPWNVTLGDYSVVGPGTELYSVGTIVLEPYAEVAQHCYLCSASHDYTLLTKPLTVNPVRIQSYAWLAAWVFVGPGVTVGEGAVCGGRACVFKDVEPWTVVGGNPAKLINKRVLADGQIPPIPFAQRPERATEGGTA